MKIYLSVSIALSLLVSGLCRADGSTRFDYAFEQDASVPIVNIGIAFRRGSSTDPKGLGGLTYFMSEMLLKGTKLRTKDQLELRMDELGSSIRMHPKQRKIQMLLHIFETLHCGHLPFVPLRPGKDGE